MSVYMTRRPIFDHNTGVYAYEILYRADDKEQVYDLTKDSSERENSFYGINVKTVTGGVRAFINFSAELVLRGVPKMFSPEILVVEVSQQLAEDKDIDNILDMLQELKERGYMISLRGYKRTGTHNDLFSLCDFVRMDLSAQPKEIEMAGFVCRYSNKLMLADGVETYAEFENAKRLGCTYMRGSYFARPPITSSGSVQPLPANLMQVMQLMAQPEPEISDIVEVMSRDTALCQKILRLINSVYFGMSNKVSSINQAIMILGLNYLREWVYLMGMQKITQNENIEVIRQALLTAKFCRSLSEMLPEASGQSDSFYLMGLLSMIVYSGERALAQALDELPLATDIKKGLLRRGGIYGDVFEMSLLYLEGKWDEFEDVARKYRLRPPEEMGGVFAQCAKEIENLSME